MHKRFIVFVLRWTAFVFTTSVWMSCTPQPFYLYPDGGLPDTDADTDAPDNGDTVESDADVIDPCIPPGVAETCNGLDDDCDGVIDNGFNLQEDPSNCGVCGRVCTFPNAEVICDAGECRFVSCLPGFADIDPDLPGCEYACPVYPPQFEDCNGVDDDCDGNIDELEDLPPAPTGLCRATPGTPCEGTVMICTARGNPPITTWYCDYDARVEFDPRVPNGIVMEESFCDGYDGDCDTVADDPFTDLGQVCDNGDIGACRNEGRRVCDLVTKTDTICDFSLGPDPDPLAPRAEECNGIDDNCDGIVDNADPTDPDRVIDDMVHITHSGLDFYIYRYEASRPDATALSAGILDFRPCSRSGVLPWANINFSDAQIACQSVGKRLCTAAEWQAACAGLESRVYTYGNTYIADACNGVDYDAIPGGDDDDVRVPAGSLTTCVSADGVFDLSGNLREWTDDRRGTTSNGDPVYVLRGGDFHTPYPGLTCWFDLSQAASSVPLPTVGFRCCSDTAP